MIIFGMRPRHRTIASGTFSCPHCQHDRTYEHKKGKTYFTLYFIPIIPIADGGEFIECQSCKRTYNLEALKHEVTAPQSDLASVLNNIKSQFERDISVEYVVSDLTAKGFDRDIAHNMVTVVIGDGRKECPRCQLTYPASWDTCPECKVVLV